MCSLHFCFVLLPPLLPATNDTPRKVGLKFKFDGGPVLVFGVQLVFFGIFFVCMIWQTTTPHPNDFTIAIGLLVNFYFTAREF